MKEKIIETFPLVTLSLGLLSIFFSIQGLFLYASYLLLAAAVAGIIERTVPRLLKTGTSFGKDLTHISGALSFAVAPGIFSYLVLFEQFSPPLNYLFLILPLALGISGVTRAARLSSGQVTPLSGMGSIFNVLLPLLYLLNFFSILLVSGWMILSSVFMLSKFSLRRPFRRKKKEKNVELKGDHTELKDDEEEDKKEEAELVPLSIFGD